MVIFHSYVSLPEGKHAKPNTWVYHDSPLQKWRTPLQQHLQWSALAGRSDDLEAGPGCTASQAGASRWSTSAHRSKGAVPLSSLASRHFRRNSVIWPLYFSTAAPPSACSRSSPAPFLSSSLADCSRSAVGGSLWSSLKATCFVDVRVGRSLGGVDALRCPGWGGGVQLSLRSLCWLLLHVSLRRSCS